MRWVPVGERRFGDVVILDVECSMEVCDIDTELPAYAARMLDAGSCKLVVNLEKVNTIDSSGLGGLLRAYAHVKKRNGDLRLVHVSPRVHSVLETTKLITVLQVFDSEEKALASFGAAT